VNSVCELPNLFMQASACSEYLAKFGLGSRICFSFVAFDCLKFVFLLLGAVLRFRIRDPVPFLPWAGSGILKKFFDIPDTGAK
jgi:hypothetical protein